MRRGNRRLISSPDSAIFRQKEPKLMTKMVVPLACSSSEKCVARHPSYLLFSKLDPRKDSSGYDASWISKGDEEEEGALHNFTRILLAMIMKRKRRIIIRQELVIYLS
jgi:hypothetical protein